MKERLLVWLSAALGTAFLAVWPLPELGRSLGDSLLIAPLVAAALAEIGHAAGRRARGLRPEIELAALVAALAFACWGTRLGIVYHRELAAAALFSLLLAAALGRALALRPLLGRRLPQRPPWPFFALPFVFYLALIPWSSGERPPDGDEPYYLLVAHSLAYDFDSELTDEYREAAWRGFLERPLEPQPGDPHGSHGEIYSRHNLLLPLLLSPAYRLFGLFGAQAVMAALAAALAYLTLRLARHYFRARPGEAFLAWLAVAFLSPLVLYSGQVWVEVPAALLAALSLDKLLELKYDRRWNRRRWLAIGLPILLLPLLKIRFVLLAVPLLALAWWHAGRPRKPLLLLAGALAVVLAGLVVHNQLVYGNPLKIHTWGEVDLVARPLSDYLAGGSGIFFDAAFGLVTALPIWLLLAAAWPLLLARSRPLLFDGLALLAPYLIVVSSRNEWYGGWSPPFRYPLVALPLLTLALVPLLGERRRAGARALLTALAACTVVLLLLWLVLPGWTYNFADGRSYLLDRLGTLFGADVARLVPSSVRPRPATWLAPLIALVLVPLAWRWPRRRAGAAATVAGLAVLLLAAAAVPLAASRLPTRTVEFEDAWVAKGGGHLHPEPWVIERTRHRGGWVLREGEGLSAPIAPGGSTLRLLVEAEWIRNTESPIALELAAGEQRIALWQPAVPRRWERLEFGPLAWPRGEPLVLRVLGQPGAAPVNGIVVDRARLLWR